MSRIQLMLAALAIVVASFAAFSGPAMANDNWNNNWDNGWWWNSEVRDCPFWGDTSGIVNQWDCFN